MGHAVSRSIIRSTFAVAVLTAMSWAAPLQAQTPAKPGAKPGAKPPAPARRPAPKPAAPATAAKPAEPARPPAPSPPQDVRFKTSYVTGDQKTETVTFVKGERERFEFQDMVLLKQHDQKRVIQISRAANTYLVAPEGMPAADSSVAAVAPGAPPKAPGVVMVATTIVDTGERKTAFGQQARHVKTMIDKQPLAGACDTSKQRIETDGWYIDLPKALQAQAAPAEAPGAPAGGCNDQVNATHNGDPQALGFPIAYTTTIIGDDGRPSVVSMEVADFEMTTLDPALFEIPQGLNAVLNIGELGKALSNANETRLSAENEAPPAVPPVRTPGVIRIGVPELTNKTTTAVDTRALRAELVEKLIEAKYEVTPLAAAPQADLQKRAAERQLDYLLLAEVTELKVPKGGIGGMLKAASAVAAPSAPKKEATEASVSVKLVALDGKQRLSTTSKGKDGGGFSAQAGLGIARLAGGMAMGMMMGPQMMSRMYRLNSLTGGNMGGMGLLGSPDLFRMQSMGLGFGAGLGVGPGRGLGIDQTAGAASFITQQALAMNRAVSAGTPGGPSFAESLDEALDNASKAVTRALEKK
jgi:hypothetical protein